MTDPIGRRVFKAADHPQDEVSDRFMAALGGLWDDLSVDPQFEGSFSAFGGVILADWCDHGPQTHRRSAAAARRDQFDHIRLVLQVDRELRCESTGVRRVVAPGQLLFTDLAYPGRFESDSSTGLALFIPRRSIEELLPRAVDLNNWMPQGASAMVLADHLRALHRSLPHLRDAEAPGLAQATLQLIAATLTPSIETLGNARAALEGALARQAERFIRENLTSPDLTVDKVCAAIKVSRATLYRFFDAHGGIATYIRVQRLRRAHHELCSRSQRVTIERLADRLGFGSVSRFSRSFTAEFGCTPSDVAKEGAPARTVPGSTWVSQGNFGDTLRAAR